MAGKPIEVQDVPDERRYEIRVGGELAGIAIYEDAGTNRTFVHTETEPRYEGQGLAGRLVSAALDDTRAKGMKVTASCPYVRNFIRRHAEYQDLLG